MGVLGAHHNHKQHHQHHHHHHMSFHFHLHIPHLHFHHNHHENNKKDMKDIPKGCLAILVGQGEEQQRFVIPVMYMNHPLFMQLLKEAEEEYGFDQKGPITIPCHVEQFRTVQGMIDREKCLPHHHAWCFKVWFYRLIPLANWSLKLKSWCTCLLFIFSLVIVFQFSTTPRMWCWFNDVIPEI